MSFAFHPPSILAVDLFLRNADKLPLTMKSAAMRDWLSKIESTIDSGSESTGILVRSYASFCTVALSRNLSTQSTDPTSLQICKRFSNPANQALSVICRSSFHRSFEGDARVHNACQRLAELIDKYVGLISMMQASPALHLKPI